LTGARRIGLRILVDDLDFVFFAAGRETIRQRFTR